MKPLPAYPWLLIAFLALLPVRSVADGRTNGLTWLAASNRVDARIQGWPLNRVLGKVARATGWEIRIEPGTQRTVTAGFAGLSQREALGRLLAGLNFAVLPRSNAPSRLLIFRSTRESATELVEAETETPAEGPIREEFILRVKPGVKLKPGEVGRIARLFGGELVAGLDELGAYRLRFPTAEAAEKAREAILRANENVTAEDNYRIAQPGRSPERAVAAATVQVPPLVNKDGPVVALIDTAVQALPADLEALVLSRTQVAAGNAASGELLHGTSMAQALAAGMQQAEASARIRAYDVYGGSPTTSTFDVARAMVQAARDGASVFNLSLGGATPSPLLGEINRQITDQGGVIFAAAGNEPGTQAVFPAAYPWVNAVTARDSTGQIAAYANTGAFVDLAAPGTATVQFGDQTYLVTGTSTASAWTAGLAAGLASRNKVAAPAVLPLLRNDFGLGAGQP